MRSTVLSNSAPQNTTPKNIGAAAAAFGDAGLRPATILFANVRGFSVLAKTLPPSRLIAAINNVFDVLDGPVVRLGGEVDKFVGDSMMATFGAPSAHEDDARRAVIAALEMHEKLRHVNRRLRLRAGTELELRVGINTGVVLAGPIGSHRNHPYTVIGDAVNVAARLQQAAPFGGVLIGEATKLQLEDSFRVHPRRSSHIRGRVAPVHSYHVLGPTHADNRAQPGQLCIGRQAQLHQLADLLRSSASGRQVVARVRGPLGVGKTQVLRTLRLKQRRLGSTWLVTSCPPYGHDLPYSTLAALLRVTIAHVRRQHRDVDPVLDDLIARACDSEGIDPQIAVTVVRDLMGRPVGASGVQAHAELEPQLGKDLLARITRALLRSARTANGCVVVLDDSQWLDAASAAIIGAELSDAGSSGITWLIAGRADSGPAASLRVDMDLQVLPLGASASGEVVHALLGRQATAEVAAFVLKHAEGNPLHLVELCRAIAQQEGVVDPELLQQRLAGSGSPQFLSDRLRALFQARLDALDSRARGVVNVAAVLGHAFPIQLLHRMLGPGQWSAVLRQLEQHNVLRREVLPGDGAHSSIWTWRFQHALLQETAYAGLLLSTRTRLHHLAGLALEEMTEVTVVDRLALLALLALHFSRSDDTERAVRYLCAAGDHARGLYLNREAIRYCDAALARLGESSEDALLRATVLADRGAAHDVLAEDEAVIANLRQAVQLEPRPAVRAERWREIAKVHRRRGAFGEAAVGLARALAELDMSDSPVGRARICIAESMLARGRRDHNRARALGLQAVELLRDEDTPRELAAAHREVAIAAARTGELDVAQKSLRAWRSILAARSSMDSW